MPDWDLLFSCGAPSGPRSSKVTTKARRFNYLANVGSQAGAVGRVQTPADWVVDRVAWKRLILVGGSIVLAMGGLLLGSSGKATVVYTAEGLVGLGEPPLGPTLAAITMGLVGARLFDCQFGWNQGLNAAGNCLLPR